MTTIKWHLNGSLVSKTNMLIEIAIQLIEKKKSTFFWNFKLIRCYLFELFVSMPSRASLIVTATWTQKNPRTAQGRLVLLKTVKVKKLLKKWKKKINRKSQLVKNPWNDCHKIINSNFNWLFAFYLWFSGFFVIFTVWKMPKVVKNLIKS